jgi:hypothetical protein
MSLSGFRAFLYFYYFLGLFGLMLMIIGEIFAEKRDERPLHFARGYQNNVRGESEQRLYWRWRLGLCCFIKILEENNVGGESEQTCGASFFNFEIFKSEAFKNFNKNTRVYSMIYSTICKFSSQYTLYSILGKTNKNADP